MEDSFEDLASFLSEQANEPAPKQEIIEDKEKAPEVKVEDTSTTTKTPESNETQEVVTETQEVTTTQEEVIEEVDEDNFKSVIDNLKSYNVGEELSEEHWKELNELSGNKKLEKYLEIQSAIKEEKTRDEAYKMVDDIINNLPPKTKEIVIKTLDGLTVEEALDITNKSMELSSITPEKLSSDETLQEKLVKEFYKDQNYDADEIETLLDGFKKKDILEKKAIEILGKSQEKLKAREEARKEEIKQKELANKQARDRYINDLNSLVQNTTEVIPGVKLTAAEKDNLKQRLTQTISTVNGPRLALQLTREKDPKSFDLKVNYLDMLGVFNDPKKWEDILKVGSNKKIDELAKHLKSTDPQFKNSSSKKPNTDTFAETLGKALDKQFK